MFRRNLESCKSKKRWIWGRNLDFVRKLALVWKGSDGQTSKGDRLKDNEQFRGQSVLEIEAVHNLRKVRMYLNVLSLRSTS